MTFDSSLNLCDTRKPWRPLHVLRWRRTATIGRGLVAALFVTCSISPASASAARDEGRTADRGSKAQQLIASAARHEHAEGTSRDYARAHALYCEAARSGSADALLRMGWMYANGRGVERSDATANALFRRAASMGNDVAERLAGVIRGREGVAGKLPVCLNPRSAIARAGASGVFNPAEASRFQASLNTPARRKLVADVITQATRYNIDPLLVLAVIAAESNFDPNARSPKNAQGLMQLIPETAARFAVANIFDPVDNVRGGIRYLRWLLSHFRGNVDLALAAYNAGEGAVNRHKGIPPYAETMNYVARIRARYPHEHHPFDSKLADASPLASAASASDGEIQRVSMEIGRKSAQPTTRVTYFLDGARPRTAQLRR